MAVESKQQPESNQKDEVKPESLANSSINKRRGLVIVKKKKDEQPKVEKSSSPTMINNKPNKYHYYEQYPLHGVCRNKVSLPCRRNL